MSSLPESRFMSHGVFTGPGLIHDATHTCPEDSRHRQGRTSCPGRICRSSSPSYKGALLPALPSSLSPPMRASASEATLLPWHPMSCVSALLQACYVILILSGGFIISDHIQGYSLTLFSPSMTQPLSPDFPFSLKQDVPTS